MRDGRRFDSIARERIPETTDAGYLLLDCDLRIRALNSAYERMSLRHRDELLGHFIFDLFPDDPDDPHARGTSKLADSLQTALRRRATDTMPILRYDIPDPMAPEVFIPKAWTMRTTSVHTPEEQFGVLLRVSEITDLHSALSALALNVAGGETLAADEQVHTLAALAGAVNAHRDQHQALMLEVAQLRRAIDTRDVIGQAKGMLMERYDVSAAAAFTLLVELSQTSNTRLEEIARRLVAVDHPGP